MAKAPIGFAFGGGGWLTTWYFGVLQGLIASGAFQPGVTPISGVSTGAQTAALGCSGGAPAAALHTALLGAAICLNTTTSPPCSGILDSVLRTEVNATLAPGAAARCGNTLTLGFSVPRAKRGVGGYGEPRLQARGNFRVTGFTSDEELIDGVSASGFMGCMSEPRPHTTFRGRPALAGGYT
ncbi:MAG: hypothetical protein J3K34DRAFT_416031 [Monoraphidium minutum]|nr:MAG: hypothetical protein J3K34DRAFT_416031 [Monoraphidium minutum]